MSVYRTQGIGRRTADTNPVTKVIILRANTEQEMRRAAVHVADRIAGEHPHPLDALTPKAAGRELAQDPSVRQDVLELLDALGLVLQGRTAA
jgi:hypothetical protein